MLICMCFQNKPLGKTRVIFWFFFPVSIYCTVWGKSCTALWGLLLCFSSCVWQALSSLVSLTDLSIACNTNRSYSIVHTYPFMLFRELPLWNFKEMRIKWLVDYHWTFKVLLRWNFHISFFLAQLTVNMPRNITAKFQLRARAKTLLFLWL